MLKFLIACLVLTVVAGRDMRVEKRCPYMDAQKAAKAAVAVKAIASAKALQDIEGVVTW